MEPSFANGKICYLEIPATDVESSATFYGDVFGWSVQRRGDGRLAFNDAVGQVSGTWIPGRPPAVDPGLMVYIMVADARAALEAIRAAGGEIVLPIDPNAREVVARFRDPAGNVLGIYEERALARRG